MPPIILPNHRSVAHAQFRKYWNSALGVDRNGYILGNNKMICRDARYCVSTDHLVSTHLTQRGVWGDVVSPKIHFLHQARATPAPDGEKKGSWRAASPPNLPHNAACVR